MEWKYANLKLGFSLFFPQIFFVCSAILQFCSGVSCSNLHIPALKNTQA